MPVEKCGDAAPIYRNDLAARAAFRDENQTRLHIDYTLALW